MGLLALKYLGVSPAISLELASLGIRMWSDSGDGRRSRFLPFGCPGRKGVRD